MKNLIIKSICSAALVVFATAAYADDQKTYPGSMCSFADNPLAAHNKRDHRLINLSRRSQQVTCPIVRDSVNHSVEYISLDAVNEILEARFEWRSRDNGTLSGVNAWDVDLAGGGLIYHWFTKSFSHHTSDKASYALELVLTPGSYINAYRVREDN